MSSRRKERITEKLHKIGADWFRGRDDKYTDPHDPTEDKLQNRKTYHIHPDANDPIFQNLVRFDTLKEIEEYIKARQKAAIAGGPAEADKLMAKFWDNLS